MGIKQSKPIIGLVLYDCDGILLLRVEVTKKSEQMLKIKKEINDCRKENDIIFVSDFHYLRNYNKKLPNTFMNTLDNHILFRRRGQSHVIDKFDAQNARQTEKLKALKLINGIMQMWRRFIALLVIGDFMDDDPDTEKKLEKEITNVTYALAFDTVRLNKNN